MRQPRGGLPGMLPDQLLEVVGSMSAKAVFKFLLEKGETLVLLRLFAAETWAMYGLVQNLASLVVRLVFLPVCSSGRMGLVHIWN